jgi:hypothetical protein
MGYASRLGRARINASAPQAAGMCDRCGFIFTHSTLQFQMDYAGAGLVNKNLLVCHRCMDRPQDQLRAIVIPADPIPIRNPRPANFEKQRVDKRITQTKDQRITQERLNRIVQKNGDDMLAPKYIQYYRITQINEYRKTQANDNRVTSLLFPIPFPPGPGPGPDINGIRLTQAGLIRVDQNGRIRDITMPSPSEVRLTQDGRMRITHDGRLREIQNVMRVVKGRLTVNGGERVTQSNGLRGAMVYGPSAELLKRKDDG